MTRRNLAAENFDDIRELVASGLSIAKACEQTPCSRAAFMQYLRRNPDRAEAIRAAQCPPAQGAELARAKADEIIAAIASGKSAAGACRALGVNVRKFQELCRTDARLRKQYAAAQRNRGGKAVSAKPRRRWSAEDFDAALDFIQRYRRPAVEKAMPDSVPSLASCYRRAASDAAFAKRFADAMRRHVIATAPMRFVGGEEISLLHAALMRVPAYREGWRRFKGFDDRDDLISEFVVAVLEGAIALADVDRQAARRDIVRRVAGPDRAMTSLSTSQIWADDERVTLGDTLENDDGILFY